MVVVTGESRAIRTLLPVLRLESPCRHWQHSIATSTILGKFNLWRIVVAETPFFVHYKRTMIPYCGQHRSFVTRSVIRS